MSLANLSTEKDIDADNTLKYQADHLAKALWRLTNDRIFWQNASARTQQNGRTVEKQVGGITKPGFIVVFSTEQSVSRAYLTTTFGCGEATTPAFTTRFCQTIGTLLRRTYSSHATAQPFIFGKESRRMYRTGDTDEVLERVLLKLTAKCERVKPADPSRYEQEQII